MYIFPSTVYSSVFLQIRHIIPIHQYSYLYIRTYYNTKITSGIFYNIYYLYIIYTYTKIYSKTTCEGIYVYFYIFPKTCGYLYISKFQDYSEGRSRGPFCPCRTSTVNKFCSIPAKIYFQIF